MTVMRNSVDGLTFQGHMGLSLRLFRIPFNHLFHASCRTLSASHCINPRLIVGP